MTVDTAVLPPPDMTPSLPRPVGRLRQLAVDTGYALLALLLSVAAFVLVVSGLAAGAGLLVVWVGLAVLAATLLVARGFAGVERAWLPRVLGVPVPRTAYLRPEGGPVRRLLTPLRDPQTWLDALHALVRFPLAVLGFVVTVTFWSLGLIAEGSSNSAIARALVMPPGAVEKHSQHIFAKLGLAPDEDQHRRVMATLAYLRG